MKTIISERLRKTRKINNMTADELAHKLGYSSKSTIHMWERGESIPPINVFLELSVIRDVSVDYLLGNDSYLRKEEKLSRDDLISEIINNLKDFSKKDLITLKKIIDLLGEKND